MLLSPRLPFIFSQWMCRLISQTIYLIYCPNITPSTRFGAQSENNSLEFIQSRSFFPIVSPPSVSRCSNKIKTDCIEYCIDGLFVFLSLVGDCCFIVTSPAESLTTELWEWIRSETYKWIWLKITKSKYSLSEKDIFFFVFINLLSVIKTRLFLITVESISIHALWAYLLAKRQETRMNLSGGRNGMSANTECVCRSFRFNSIYISQWSRQREGEQEEGKFKLNTHCVLKPWDVSFHSICSHCPEKIVMLRFLLMCDLKISLTLYCFPLHTDSEALLSMTGH